MTKLSTTCGPVALIARRRDPLFRQLAWGGFTTRRLAEAVAGKTGGRGAGEPGNIIVRSLKVSLIEQVENAQLHLHGS